MASKLLFFLAAASLMCVSLGSLFQEKRALPQEIKVCKKMECEERAKMILKYLNKEANPCEDFRKYVCGWDGHDTVSEFLPDGEFQRLTLQTNAAIKDILDKLPKINQPTNATEGFILMYQTCMNSSLTGDEELTDIRTLLQEGGFRDWPMQSNGNSKSKHFQGLDQLLSSIKLPNYFLDVTAGVDPENRKSKVVWVMLKSTTGAAHSKIFHTIFGNDSNPENMEIEKDMIKKILMAASAIIRPGTPNDEQEAVAKDFLRILENLHGKSNVSSTETYMKKSIKGFESYMPSFPLLNIINVYLKEVNVELNHDDIIVVKNPEAFKWFVQYLQTENLDSVFNFIGMSNALTALKTSSREFQNVAGKIYEDETGILSTPNKSIVCEMMFETVPSVLSRIYVLHQFDKETQLQGLSLLKHISKAYYKTLEFIPWMDKETRQHAIEKMYNMRPIVGFSDTLLNETLFESQYNYVKDFRKNVTSFRMLSLVLKMTQKGKLSQLKGENVIEEYKYQEDNAFYTTDKNEIVIPAGILKGAFFSLSIPEYLNLGALGAIMAHKMTYAFDMQGSTQDGQGQLGKWWSNYTLEEFKHRANCFKELYNNSLSEAEKVLLRRPLTLPEIIADNIGIRVAIKAFRQYQHENADIRLPGLEDLTNEQLFLISYALPSCSLDDIFNYMYNEDIIIRVPSPFMVRMRLALKNLEEFSAAFHCKTGTQMRLPDKYRCVMW